MSKWVSKEEVSWLKLYHSTDEKRLVSVASDKPLEVFPISKKAYRAPMFRRDYDSFAFVDMEQKTVYVEMTGNVTTKDKVRIVGKVGIQTIIKDDDSCIRRVVINEDEELLSFNEIVFEVIRSTIAEESWCDIVPVKKRITDQVEETLLGELNKANEKGEPKYCFQFSSLSWPEITPKDKELADSLEKEAKDIAEEERKKKVGKQKEERRIKEREYEIVEEGHQDDIIKFNRKRKKQIQADDLRYDRVSAKLKIQIAAKTIPLISTTQGQMYYHPKEVFELLKEKVKVEVANINEEKRLIREITKAQGSWLGGENTALKKLLTTVFNVRDADENLLPQQVMDPSAVTDDLEGEEDEETENGNNTAGPDEKETKPEENA